MRVTGRDGRRWRVGRAWLPWRVWMPDVDGDFDDPISAVLAVLSLLGFVVAAVNLAACLLVAPFVLLVRASTGYWKVVARNREAGEYVSRVRGFGVAGALAKTVEDEIFYTGRPTSLVATSAR